MKVCGWEGYTQTDRAIWRSPGSHVLEILLETKTRTRLTYKCWKSKINITFSDFLKQAKKNERDIGSHLFTHRQLLNFRWGH